MAADESPLTQLSDDDPGDDVQRRFRYQHAFGVVLLLASLRGERDYVALWCEKHEDFLAETADGKFDAFQVKTRDTGDWQVNDQSFYGSIQRFARLDGRAPASIRAFSFVTNAKPFETDSAERTYLCPLRLLDAVKAVADVTALNESNNGRALKLLADKTEIDQQVIFETLKKTAFVTSMPLDGFESLLAHEHLAKYEPCQCFSPSLLDRIVERLISLVFSASSLAVTDPARHYAPLSGIATIPEKLLAKRLSSQVVALAIREITLPPFRYRAGLSTLQATSPASWSILKRKMERGGIEAFFDMIYRRAISAEAYLLGLDQSSDLVNQIVNLVADQCDEIRLKYHGSPDPCGDSILLETINRFETMARDQPIRTYRQPPEMLIGVAGLLAGDCKVWWSKTFDLRERAT